MNRILNKIRNILEEENNINRYEDFYYLTTFMGNSLSECLSKELLRDKLIKDDDSKELKLLINEVIDENNIFRKKLLFTIPPLLALGFINNFIS